MSEEGTPPAEGGGGEGTPQWTDGLDDAGKAFVETKGWKEPGDLLKSYQGLETFHGVPAEQIVKLPGKPDDKEAWGEVYRRLGRPDESKGYDLPEVSVAEGDYDLAPDFREWSHEMGLSQSQARGLFEKYMGRMTTLSEEMAQRAAEEASAAKLELEKEWGDEYEANISAAKRFARTFGLTEEWLDQLEGSVGYKALIEGAARIGRGLGEHALAEGGGSPEQPLGLTPAAARGQIEKLKLDSEFMAAYMNGDHPAHKEAVERMLKLNERMVSGE